MSLILVLAGVGTLAVTAALILAVLTIGIRQGDRRHLATGPRSASGTFARRLLLGVRYPAENGEQTGPVSRITDLSAMIMSVGHRNEFGGRKRRARSRWFRHRTWRSRKSPNRHDRARKGDAK